VAHSDAVESLPGVLRVPLSEPMFILGTLFVLVVLFLPGGVAGTAATLTGRRRRSPESLLAEVDDARDEPVLEGQR
jgi:branched-chain amino acid transport system permease protein